MGVESMKGIGRLSSRDFVSISMDAQTKAFYFLFSYLHRAFKIMLLTQIIFAKLHIKKNTTGNVTKLSYIYIQ